MERVGASVQHSCTPSGLRRARRQRSCPDWRSQIPPARAREIHAFRPQRADPHPETIGCPWAQGLRTRRRESHKPGLSISRSRLLGPEPECAPRPNKSGPPAWMSTPGGPMLNPLHLGGLDSGVNVTWPTQASPYGSEHATVHAARKVPTTSIRALRKLPTPPATRRVPISTS